jgi:Nuclease-related domain
MTQAQPHVPGAAEEEVFGARLTELAGERLVVLHDRRMPASRGNIDHLAVTPRGVFVIDVKHDSGRLERRNLGNAVRPDVRLYVGGCDRTMLLQGVEDRAEVVREILSPAWFVDSPVRGVLCFTGAEWGLLASPFKLGNVLVTYPKFLHRLLGKEAEVATSAIHDAARALAIALP